MALSDFRNGYTSVSLYSDVLYADIRQHKKLLCQQKKIFRIEINVAQQNYVSYQKNMFWQQKNYVAPRKKSC